MPGKDFRSHTSLLIIFFGFFGLVSFPVEAAIKKYQFDVSYIYMCVCVCVYVCVRAYIHGQDQHMLNYFI